MLTLLVLSMSTLGFVKAAEDPIVSGTVRDKQGNPIPDVLIIAQDVATEIEVASTTSNATGAYALSVPPNTYNLIVRPPPESGFGNTTITNIEVITDIAIDIVLIPAETVAFSGAVTDQDGNPLSDVNICLYNSVSECDSTDEDGLFSMRVPPDNYTVRLSGDSMYYDPRVPQDFSLYKATRLNLTEDTSMNFTLHRCYLTGKVDCEGNPVANVYIRLNGETAFDEFHGWFSGWNTSDSQGNFNITVFINSTISLRATPPPESPYAPVRITNINMTDDKTILIALVYKAGVRPTAEFTWTPAVPEVGEPVTFNASTSTPGSGIIIKNVWSFGDGEYGLGEIATHSYAESGNYTVTLNVTNSKGLWDTEQKQIEVVEPAPGPKPPVASFTFSPANPKVNEEVTFDASASLDPDGQIVSFAWDFGDVVYGIDVRDDVNWPEVYNAGYRFAFVKATEGINWSKPGFEKRVQDAQKTGLLVGVYHFGRPVPNEDKAKEEAESFVRLAGDYLQEGHLRPALDVEDSDYYGEYPEQLGKETLAQWIKTWMDTVYDMTGVEPVLYMNGYLFQFLNDSSIGDQYDIWIPDLRDAEPSCDDSPNTRGWNTWAFWQYKLNVALAGGTADLNVFNGDISELQSFVLGGGDHTPTQIDAKIVTHSYSKEGNYEVTLTVVDDDGKSSSTSKTVTVLKSKTDERIEDAVAWASDWTDGQPYPSGGPHADEMYIGWCLAFVQDSYQFGANAKIQRYAYAKEAADALGAEDNKGIPPRGAFVFYDWYGTIDGEYRNWGHVGLSLGDGQMVHAWTSGPITASYDMVGLEYIGWAWPPLTPPIKTSGLSVLATCPVDLVIVDPEYRAICKEFSEIPGAVYEEEDLNGDGSPDDHVFIPDPLSGEYSIAVIPEPGTDPTATYTLEVSAEDATLLLAESVPISEIPSQPYTLDSTTLDTPPVTILSVGQPKYIDALGDIYVSSATPFNLTAEDNPGGSGVMATSYKIYNSTYDTDWLSYHGPFNLTGLADGPYFIGYNSTDNAGNVEPTNTEAVILDNTPPTLTIETPSEGDALQDGVTFKVSAWDLSAVDSVTFSIQCVQGNVLSPEFESMPATLSPDGTWELYFDTTQLPDGYYLFAANGTDVLGNTGTEAVEFSIRNWACLELLPASKSNKGGRTMPIKFSLRINETADPEQPFVWNEELSIIVYEKGHPEEILQNSTYGTTARDYRIDPEDALYITNFETLKTKITIYVVEVYRKDMLIGSFEFATDK